MQLNDVQKDLFFDDAKKRWPSDIAPIRQITVLNKLNYPLLVLMLQLEDRFNLIGKDYSLNEGTKLTVVFGNIQQLKEYTFRVYSATPKIIDNTTVYQIVAYEDLPKWWLDTTTEAFEGTSNQAIQKIAEKCGLKFEGDECSDSQKWLGFGQKNYVFARKIALHGWRGKNSIMSLAYVPGGLLYRDVNNLPEQAKFSFDYRGFEAATSTNFQITSHELYMDSGAQNVNGSLKTQGLNPNIESGETDKFEKIKINKMGGSRVPGEELRKSVENPTIINLGRSTSNVHPDFQQAKFNNTRGRLMFGLGIAFTTPRPTPLRIFDVVEIKISGRNVGGQDASEHNQKTYDGRYFVDSKILHVDKAFNYAELLICRRPALTV